MGNKLQAERGEYQKPEKYNKTISIEEGNSYNQYLVFEYMLSITNILIGIIQWQKIEMLLHYKI